jgi:CheY-like chemotaxis protein
LKRILVVADEPIVRLVLAELLCGVADNVATAANGRDALDKVEESRYELVLLDLRMPGLDGRSRGIHAVPWICVCLFQ